MKTKLIFAALLLAGAVAEAGTEKPVSSVITGATVYFNNALVTRTADVNVGTGVTTLVFEHISPLLIDKTMQVKATGNLLVIDVKHEVRYTEPMQPVITGSTVLRHDRVAMLEDSLFFSQASLQRIQARKSDLEKEMEILGRNRLYTGAGRSDSMPVLKEMMIYYRSKMEEIQDELYQTRLEEHKRSKQVAQMTDRLNTLKSTTSDPDEGTGEGLPNHCILVTVSADQAASGNMTVSYLVDGAGWEPGYDLRSGSSKTQLTITYKANVYQNTGEDWNNVKLKLSTYINAPSQNEKPELPSWVLDYYQVQQQSSWNLSSNMVMNTTLPTVTGSELPPTVTDAPLPSVTDISGFFNTDEFDVKLARTIRSDGNRVLMVLQNKEVPVDYTFCLVPKLNRNAFLVARLPGGSSLDLLPAVSNIYVDDTYMGQTSVSENGLDDTLEFSMGKDEDIICGRKKIKDAEKKSVLGKTNLRTITIELVVKNNKPHEVNVNLEDQVPVPGNETILVKVLDKDDAVYDEATGLLKWDLRLQPKQTRKIKFTYTIEYDKDKKI
jgi:uncharacterized protein (TIGR02231 family)